jgi:hypothetical protein
MEITNRIASLRAVCTREPNVDLEFDEGPFRLVFVRNNGSVANTGRRFASLADARLFAEGADLVARLVGGRVLFEDCTRRVCTAEWNAHAAGVRCSVDVEEDGAMCGHCRRAFFEEA